MTSPTPDEMIAALEAQGNFRVLRRLHPIEPMREVPTGARRAVLVDVETTGLDPSKDEIIELAMVPFFYSANDEIVGIGDSFSALRQPSRPISAEVTKLTGIDSAMVAGKSIDPADVAAFADGNLVIAHNAPFDRRFLERFCPALAENPWACSMSEVGWAGEGFESSKLAYLALSSGFYYDRHRALNDCHAAIELLSRPLPVTGMRALAALLASARGTTLRCWAENSPFESKDVLKLRGYRWNGDDNAQPRAWWIDVREAEIEAEKAFLCSEIYKRVLPLPTAKITAFNRHSDRILPG
ncbi:3'-5' exonuclease [Novosphingobium sp.]|uniref:3'-5' exonuclease n=1 Tax=Novosphingobium sp. TaxID=1874826 RepID=UPI00260D4C84|nr:3'-5' exonuclease [Novosphingobium sp.]